MKRKLNLATLLFIMNIFLVNDIKSQITYQTVSNGIWTSLATWSGGVIPPISLSPLDTIIINHNIGYNVNQIILGTMIINSTGSITGANSLFIGLGGVNQGTLINYGSISIDELTCEPDDCLIPYSPVDPMPVVNNYGTINVADKIKIGQDCGSGSLYNFPGGNIFTDELQVDGYLCNQDSIYVISDVEVEGGTIDCCGFIQTPSIQLEENDHPLRPGNLMCQRFCTTAGGAPIIEVDDVVTLVPGVYLNANPTQGVVDPLTTFCNLILPIELVYFNVKLVNSRFALITWSTSSENNNDYFTIEKSTNNINWEIVSIVQGAGNSQGQIDYQLSDFSPYSGISYYRLTQTDFNGQSDVFKVRSINNNELNGKYTIHPNPVAFDLFVECDIDDVKELIVYSILGENLTQETVISKVNQNRFKIDVSLFPVGVYYVKINGHATKFVKR